MNSKIRTIINARYMDTMKGLRLTPDEYKQLKRAFQGGYSHANSDNFREIEQCESIDNNSVYENMLCVAAYPLNERGKYDYKFT